MKNIIITKPLIALAFILLLAASSCIHKKFKEPFHEAIPIGNVLNIADLYKIYNDSILSLNKEKYKFLDDCSVYATVSMDDKSGNIYKSAYIQDPTGGMNLHLTQVGGLYEGDSIRIYLRGTSLGNYAGVLQLDSVNVDKNITKIATYRNITPDKSTVDQINAGLKLSKLVKIENVQFSDEELGKTYANAKDKKAEDRILVDENNQKILVRTSGYANFANKEIPRGRGSIIAIASTFNATPQLYIRNEYELAFNLKRFGEVETIFSENFESVENNAEITSNNIKTISTIGSTKWLGFNNGQVQYAKLSGTFESNTSYLILPKLDIQNCFLSFSSRCGQNYGGKLHLLYSTNYDGTSSPETANWNEIPVNFPEATQTSYSNWLDSGEISLQEYAGQIHLAFRYSSNADQKATFLLDNILIYKK